MLENIVLGLASLFPTETVFFEQEFEVPTKAIEIETEIPFNAVSLFSKTPKSLPEIFYWDGEKFANWHYSEDGNNHNKSILDVLYFDEPRNSLIIKSSREIEVVAHFFNTVIEGENEMASILENESSDFLDDKGRQALGIGYVPKFYTRKDWGADESLRSQKTLSQKLWGIIGQTWFTKEIEAVDPELRPTVKENKNFDGKSLFWPISENKNIAKFIIHHTGEAVKSRKNRNPMEIMRAIYNYHAITRGWGDIGYNYVIDKQGNVYEGRAGGAKSLGAHTMYHNVGSLGISLMGNFNYEEPTEAQIQILSILLADHSRRFGVDVLASDFFLGKNSHNISGHRDVARTGHGTACPGVFLHKKLPKIRENTQKFINLLDKYEREGRHTGLDFLLESKIVQEKLGKKEIKIKEKEAPFSLQNHKTIPTFKRQETKIITIEVVNNSKYIWHKGDEIEVKNSPEGLVFSKFRLVENVGKGKTGVFRGNIKIKNIDNGKYQIEFWPKFLEKNHFKSQLEESQRFLNIQISGNFNKIFSTKKLVANSFDFPFSQNKNKKINDNLQKTEILKNVGLKTRPKVSKLTNKNSFNNLKTTEPDIKIKISDFAYQFAEISGSKTVEIWDDNKKIFSAIPNLKIKIFSENKESKKLRLEILGKKFLANNFYLKTNNGILTIHNYYNSQFGGGKIFYNKFRENLNIYQNKDKLLLVNELSLENYLAGIAEEPKTEPEQKKHAIHILARSYAFVYAGNKRKFHTNLYDLEDDPRTSQLYLGYDWEKRHSEQRDLIKKTKGIMLSYKGIPVIGPYFTQSSGESSSKWVSQYPWTIGRKLPFDEGLETKGHTVGLSGNSARKLADQGKNFREILDYFFQDTSLIDVYQ